MYRFDIRVRTGSSTGCGRCCNLSSLGCCVVRGSSCAALHRKVALKLRMQPLFSGSRELPRCWYRLKAVIPLPSPEDDRQPPHELERLPVRLGTAPCWQCGQPSSSWPAVRPVSLVRIPLCWPKP
ncbi:hypothetical protein C8T65DRAFT_32378 [Cerioporus squamosus]|nr:hypothetical protein C8T65DRAFT_32378 [Cerioporus squamosus]